MPSDTGLITLLPLRRDFRNRGSLDSAIKSLGGRMKGEGL